MQYIQCTTALVFNLALAWTPPDMAKVYSDALIAKYRSLLSLYFQFIPTLSFRTFF